MRNPSQVELKREPSRTPTTQYKVSRILRDKKEQKTYLRRRHKRPFRSSFQIAVLAFGVNCFLQRSRVSACLPRFRRRQHPERQGERAPQHVSRRRVDHPQGYG